MTMDVAILPLGFGNSSMAVTLPDMDACIGADTGDFESAIFALC
jgi:hypothetical protein